MAKNFFRTARKMRNRIRPSASAPIFPRNAIETSAYPIFTDVLQERFQKLYLQRVPWSQLRVSFSVLDNLVSATRSKVRRSALSSRKHKTEKIAWVDDWINSSPASAFQPYGLWHCMTRVASRFHFLLSRKGF